jgi:hypothetical protein
MIYEYDVTIDVKFEDRSLPLEERLQEVIDELNERGKQGWELIQTHTSQIDNQRTWLHRVWKRAIYGTQPQKD